MMIRTPDGVEIVSAVQTRRMHTAMGTGIGSIMIFRCPKAAAIVTQTECGVPIVQFAATISSTILRSAIPLSASFLGNMSAHRFIIIFR